MSRTTWLTFAEIEALVTIAATAFLLYQSRKQGQETRLLVAGFVILSARALFHLVTPPEGVYRLFHGFWVPVLDQALMTLFFLLVAYALQYPLFPAYRQPITWILLDNLAFLMLLTGIVTYDFAAHWQPRTKFITHWGSIAFETYQFPLLLLIVAVTIYVYRRGRARSILLAAGAFALWSLSCLAHLGAGLTGAQLPAGWGWLTRGGDLLAVVLLALASTLPDSARQTFAQRYFADARATVKRLESQLAEMAAAKALLEERQRLARELHDSVSQALFGVELNISAAEMLLEQDPGQAQQRLERARQTAHEASGDLRALIADLRPPALAGKSILDSLRAFARSLEEAGQLAVRVEGGVEKPMSPAEEAELYRIAYEAVNNAAKHAQAAEIHVALQIDDPRFRLEVADDGIGFNPERRKPGSWGLVGMRERAERLGASLKIESTPGQGTRIIVERE